VKKDLTKRLKKAVEIARKSKKPKLVGLARKSRKKLKPESIVWYKAEWTKMTKGFDVVSDAFLTGLAQLSYENKQLRNRLSALEAILLAQMFGKVEIRGDLHLIECAKRRDPDHICTCGSTPDEERSGN
jgi:hypothetical protein